MIAMKLAKPKTEVEATVLIACEICGDVTQYDAARRSNWVAVGGGPWRYRCHRRGCMSGKLDFVDDNQCDGCRRGLPVDENGVHFGAGFDMIGCTANRYNASPRPIIEFYFSVCILSNICYTLSR